MPSEARRSNARQLLARIRPHKNAAVLFVIPNRLSGESLPCFCRSPEPSEGEVEGNLLSRVFRSLFQPCRQSTSCLLPRAPRSRGPSDSSFRAMSHFPHFSSAGAEYFSPARERWLEISHD